MSPHRMQSVQCLSSLIFGSFSEKVLKLLEDLWACVEPKQLPTERHSLFTGETNSRLYLISRLFDLAV